MFGKRVIKKAAHLPPNKPWRVPACTKHLCTASVVLVAAVLLGCCSGIPTSAIAHRAQAGDAQAQYEYGRRLLTGQGIRKEPSLAPGWFLAAAQQGHAKAQAALATCYKRGLGIPRNDKWAELWFKRAAAQSEEHAIYALLEWAGQQRTPQAAARYLHPMLEAHHPIAELYLATFYLLSTPNTPEHQHKAIDYLRYAAIGGSGEAAFLLALCYVEGYGVCPIPELAIGWFINAAELGYEPARHLLHQLQQLDEKNTVPFFS